MVAHIYNVLTPRWAHTKWFMALPCLMAIKSVWSDNYYFSFIDETVGSESLCNLAVLHNNKYHGQNSNPDLSICWIYVILEK